MTRAALLALGLACIAPTLAPGADDKDARTLAQGLLDKGSALFDARDSAVMAATWAEDGRLTTFLRDEATGDLTRSVKEGRAQVEEIYRDAFRNKDNKTTSRNTVESAALLAPDLLLIRGTFEPDLSNKGKYPFVQIRTKKGDAWLVKDLQFFVIPQD